MKKDKIIYWASTGIISAMFLFSAFLYLTHAPQLVAGMKSAGYPIYFIGILGTAKLLGAIALLTPFEKLKEWAYAGFAFTLIGATWTHIATSTPFVAPLVFIALLSVSYIFNQRLKSYRIVKA